MFGQLDIAGLSSAGSISGGDSRSGDAETTVIGGVESLSATGALDSRSTEAACHASGSSSVAAVSPAVLSPPKKNGKTETTSNNKANPDNSLNGKRLIQQPSAKHPQRAVFLSRLIRYFRSIRVEVWNPSQNHTFRKLSIHANVSSPLGGERPCGAHRSTGKLHGNRYRL